MSMTAEELETERAERPVLHRTFEAEITRGDGRTVDVRVVPYGIAAEVSDDGRTVYREEWAPGCFDDQLVAGHRLKVLLNYQHLQGIDNVVGKGVALRSQPDGLHGSFRVLDGSKGDTALDLINDGILDSVSLEAFPKRGGSVRTAEGIIRRVKAHLQNVALCREGAFADARVLAVREAHHIVDEIPPELLPTEMDPEVVERCRRLGIKLPQRYQTHPAETDTPDESGTSEAAPVEHTDNSMEEA